MGSANNRRSMMTLYSDMTDIYCHQVRIVLAEKGINVDIVYIDQTNPNCEDFLTVNPKGFIPTLVDRELVLYNANIIMEYLDERFPHPPLMPVYPVVRASSRLMIYRIEQEWYQLIHRIIDLKHPNEAKAARKELLASLLSVTTIFEQMPYFMSEEFSLVDCVIAPLLWRLPLFGIELPPKEGRPIADYAKRIFQRESFIASLTEIESEIGSSAVRSA